MPKSEKFQALPAPWDRIFALATRIFVWALLAGVVYLLRPFFLLIFLTFVFAYIQTHAVDGLEHRFRSRAYRVTLVFIVFLGLIIGTLYFLTPHVRQQTGDFFRNSTNYMEQADAAIYKLVDENPSLKSFLEPPEETVDEKPGAKPEDEGQPKKDEKPRIPAKAGGQGETQDDKQDPPKSDRRPLVQPLVMSLVAGGNGGDGKEVSLEKKLSGIIAAGAGILGATSSFLLAILFSFLIVLDLPKLKRMVAGMANTKLDFIYQEVSENIHAFGQRLGRTLEAQVLIAIVNTFLTCIGIWLLGIDNIIFLGSIVFFCSFIPVAGVFISSGPICLMALQGTNEGGFQLVLLTIGMILLVHTIEAYILNPRIYGHHLRMNAVLVLIVLTICGKLFGVWGLVLGLPVVNYFFAIAIQRDDEDEEGGKAGGGSAAGDAAPA